MNTPYTNYRNYMQTQYGEILHRIPIDLGYSCPNRLADKSGGCSFCSEGGNKAVQINQEIDIEKQIKMGISFARKRYGAKHFIAYFQAYSTIFSKKYQAIIEKILLKHSFKVVIFGTRPDCIDQNALIFLRKLNKMYDVSIELGVQTSNESTLLKINRGHTWIQSRNMILKLNESSIKVSVHVIIGLPGESAIDFVQTAIEIGNLPIDGVKIHNLHIIKKTKLAKEYKQDPFPVFYEHEYADYLIDFIRHLPPDIPIMRLSTDTEEDQLVAPKWQLNKNQFKDYIDRKMIYQEFSQGDKQSNIKQSDYEFRLVSTKDNSLTLWNEDFKEHYHSRFGARLEAINKYITPSDLRKMILEKNVKILDVCFGMGYNSLSAINETIGSKNNLEITALEIDKRVVSFASSNILEDTRDKFAWKDCLSQIYNTDHYKKNKVNLKIHWDDARYSIKKCANDYFDIIFLDAFSSQRNSELWTVDFFKELYRTMTDTAVLLTYSSAIPIWAGLINAGFNIAKTNPLKREQWGTIASKSKSKINTTIELNTDDLAKINSTKGIPYRDPSLILTNKDILRNREMEIISKKTLIHSRSFFL